MFKYFLLILSVLGMLANSALADFPDKTIRLIVPWKAGGGTDTITRGFVEPFKKAAGVDVVITNIAGGAGSTGMIQVTKAKNDGYTLLLNGQETLVGLTTFKKMPFNFDSFEYVGGVYHTPTYALVHKDRGYKSLKEIIEKSKKNPGKLTVGIGSKAGAHDVMAQAINGFGGAKLRIVAFGGGANLKKATIANEIDLCIIHSPVLLNEVKAGMLNVVATGGSLKNINYKPVQNTPTLKQLGIPAEVGVVRGIYAPKGTPKNVISKLEKIAEKAAKSEEFKKFGLNFGFAPVWYSASDWKELQKNDLSFYKEMKEKFMN